MFSELPSNTSTMLIIRSMENSYLDGKVPSYNEGQHEDSPGIDIPGKQIIMQ